MECREAERLIPAFLNDELDNWELDAFLDHIKHCKDCEEELTIQLLVKVGLERLEDASTFHLGNELERQLAAGEEKLRHRSVLQGISFALQGLVAVGVIVVLVLAKRVLG